MKLTNIYCQAFGYNKEYHDKLHNDLSKRLKGQKLAQNDEEIKELSKDLKGYSNRSIVFLIDSAAKNAKRRQRSDIEIIDVREAIKKSDFEKADEKHFQKASKNTRKIGF